ncbi:MAG: ketoacyl-ACP synthase III [Firmicutes bacterium]|nr:ketoacyl-ACP synthase III [Bacillota bacterium]
MAGIRIIGLGKSTGDRQVTNQDLTKLVDTSDEWIRKKSGIQSRYFAEYRTNCDMAVEAAEGAIEDGAIAKEKIGYVIVCTFTPDRFTPSVACNVAGRLGLQEQVMALDINGACSGFIYGCKVANGLLASDCRKYALVIGSERISPLLDMTDRATCVLFGDGAGAAVMEYSQESQFTYYGGCVPRDDILRCDRKGENSYGTIEMSGQEVYRFAVTMAPVCMEAVVRSAGLLPEAVDYYVCHQANERIIDQVSARVFGGQVKERFYKNLYTYGNTSAASIPIALRDMKTEGLLAERPTRLVCAGFGAGLTYGGMMIEAR